MNVMRSAMSVGIVVSLDVLVATWLAVESRAQAPDKMALAGAWTLNKDLSDQPPDRSSGSGGRDGSNGGYGRRGPGGYGGGRRGGGFGGGRYGGGGGRAGMDPQEMARVRDAMRDIMNPGDRLTIVQTDSMVIVTNADGRTTRIAPDGKKVKDDSTKIERKSKWDGGKLVSEISGVGPAKLTQSFEVDDQHRLKVTVVSEGGRNGQARTVTHVYDADAK